MTAPTAARLAELRLHHAGCPDMCPDAELLAALDHVAARLAEFRNTTGAAIADELKAYIGPPAEATP